MSARRGLRGRDRSAGYAGLNFSGSCPSERDLTSSGRYHWYKGPSFDWAHWSAIKDRNALVLCEMRFHFHTTGSWGSTQLPLDCWAFPILEGIAGLLLVRNLNEARVVCCCKREEIQKARLEAVEGCVYFPKKCPKFFINADHIKSLDICMKY